MISRVVESQSQALCVMCSIYETPTLAQKSEIIARASVNESYVGSLV